MATSSYNNVCNGSPQNEDKQGPSKTLPSASSGDGGPPKYKYGIDPKTLIFCISMTHPAGGFGGDDTDLSTIGCSANFGKFSNQFVGLTYKKQKNVNEITNCLYQFFQDAIDEFTENRGFSPSKVIIYRIGIAEGLYGKVGSYEIPLFVNVLKKKAEGAVFTFIAAQKQKVKKSANSLTQASNQFIMFHSGKATKGKTLKYTVLSMQPVGHCSMDELYRITKELADAASLTQYPVYYPLPICVAKQMVEQSTSPKGV
uniref:Piwi domain-containing protein n=1 Tax=Panagrolaimus sp. PS1159 TaxID=55785 RepID=A0AC35GEC9_9BILA